MAGFQEKWQIIVDRKNSVLCAGLDPTEFKMGNDYHCMPVSANKHDYALKYIESVAPYAAALKFNLNFWKKENDGKTLTEIIELAHSLDMLVIEDCKLSDIGSTNEACMKAASEKKIDAVTYSPFAGNIQEAGEQAKKAKLGIIALCLMSNHEYAQQKNNLIPAIVDQPFYSCEDLTYINHVPHVKQYVALACRARINNIDGIVVGAPSPQNHITENEIADIARFVRDDQVILVPGIGAQSGEISLMYKYFAPNQLIVNIGRSLMYPKGNHSSQNDQREAANHFSSYLNQERHHERV